MATAQEEEQLLSMSTCLTRGTTQTTSSLHKHQKRLSINVSSDKKADCTNNEAVTSPSTLTPTPTIEPERFFKRRPERLDNDDDEWGDAHGAQNSVLRPNESQKWQIPPLAYKVLHMEVIPTLDASTLHEALIRAIQENENCQDAGYHSCTHSALKKGSHTHPMTVSSVLDDAGDALLQPHLSRSVTIAFKPILLEVLARGLSQLRMDIASSVENKRKDELETAHNGEKNTLLPHERATVALRSVLSLAPHAWPLALEHWQSSPCPFDRLRTFQGGSRLAEVVAAGHGLLVLLCSSRDRKDSLAVTFQLVLFRMKAVRYLWDWSPFFYLATGGPSIPHAEVAQRANAVVSILLDLPPPSCTSPESQACVENDEVRAFCDRMDSTIPSSIVGECSESSQERIVGAEDTVVVGKNKPQNISQELCSKLLETVVLQPSVCIIGSILHPWGKKNRIADHIMEKVVPGLVHCSTTKRNIHAVSEALAPPGPLLLFGPPASGKSAILKEIARDGGANLLELHLGDEVDMKTLLGMHVWEMQCNDVVVVLSAPIFNSTHVCTDVPGEFEWRAGPLAQAMMEGQWVLIEDFDKAPVAVLASLTPLAETEMDTVSLVVPGQPGVLRPSPGFRLLGTVTTDVEVGEETGMEQQQGGGVPCISSRLGGEANFGSLWRKVWIAPPTKEEIVAICSQAAGPRVQQRAIHALLETCRVILNEVGKSSTSMGGGGGINEGSFGLRESLKLMRRVRGSGMLDAVGGGCNNPLSNSGAPLCTASEGEAVLLDVLDIFVGHLPSTSCACKAAAAVAHLWELRPESAEGLITMRRPQLEHTNHLEESLVVIGRVALRVCSTANAKYSSFALTSASLRVMERIAACIHANEPVLLVGETGCGKTTIVQYLADQCGQQLVVQNMSLQTDSIDLLGGFKPVQLRFIAEELLQEFVQLFQRAFPNKKNATNEQYLMAVASAYEKSQWKKFSRMLSKGANAALVRMSSGGMKGEQERIGAAPNAAAQQGRNRKPARQDQMDSPGSIGNLRYVHVFQEKLAKFERQRKASEESFAFAFMEGLLVKALREGHWILLDEVNLATPEILQRLCGLLEDADGSLCLMERGDTAPLPRHPNFRIFAAMNPATDISKAPLPPSLRVRFTELFVSEPTTLEDLRLVADACLQESSQSPDSSLRPTSSFSNDKELVQTSVEFYTWCRDIARKIYDGAGLQPHYSMRSFCRAMSAANVLHRYRRFPPHRALYEGFVASFVTQLDVCSAQLVNRNLQRIFLGENFTDLQLMNKPPPRPGRRQSADDWALLKPFWLPAGPNEKEDWAIEGKFVITPTVEFTLRSVARAVAVSDAPILLQGPTSSGKTTVVEYVAKRCGHKCVRINNHEHTDLQEYVGSYCLDERGKLVFQEGILVQALRRGHWIILDELNLAPCDVLEALNRLLDDNRELLIEELQEVVKPHSRFRLFATQNPPGAYGGRKPLSRAFRNRFLELHVGDIPTQEWETILARRCSIPPSYAALLVHVMVDLQRLRQASDVFSGKEGFVSPRDLLRWANRWANRRAGIKQELAEEGYMLLAERLRDTREKQQVKEVLEARFRVQINERSLYSPPSGLVGLTSMVQMDCETDSNVDETNGASDKEACGFSSGFGGLGSLAMTSSLCRLFILIERCIVNGEAVLLVGPTGCGKTTACQVLAAYLHRVLHTTNCHQTTEAADLLGSLRPVRGREGLTQEYKSAVMEFLKDSAKISPAAMKVSNPEGAWKCVCRTLGFDASKEAEILCGEGEIEQSNLAPHSIVEPASKRVCSGKMTRQDNAQHMTEKREWEEKRKSIKHLFQKLLHIRNLHTRSSSIFEWIDGPLVTAMKNGELILLDELSLAEDAVLERLNSVLEPQRSLVLTEKNGVDVGESGGESGVSEVLYAKDGFAVLATMNPGGDFGKRELSPALRSRFTEIWVPQISDAVDLEAMLIKVVGGKTNDSKEGVVKAMLRTAGVHIPENHPSLFDRRGNNPSTADNNRSPQIELSLRDLLAWAQLIKAADEMEGMDTWHAYAHGAAMTILDRMGLGSGCSLDEVHHLRLKAAQTIASWAPTGASDVIEELMAEDSSQLPDFSWKISGPDDSTTWFGSHLFWCKCGPLPVPDVLQFSLNAPTTARNTMRLLRAMQLNKAILLEGSPGVGKTGLVQALAAATGHTLVRINLSDQTDLSDLMGNDMPMAALNLDKENANVGGFAWCDGVFLRALKTGQWVLLDEMNLATQQVLEGLNSCLDHRAEVFIPELSSVNGGCFHCHPSFRVFAAQNPLSQGGGRKGLPQSFLDRFTRVVVDPLSSADMLCITSHRFPELVEANEKAIKDMISFNSLVQNGATIPNQVYGRDGSPWEFNLRDVFRWCELLKREQLKRTLGRYVSFEERDDEQQLQILSSVPAIAPEYGTMMDILYVQRFRDIADRSSMVERACNVFGDAVAHNLSMHSHSPIRLTEERHPDAPPVGRLPLGLHRPLRAAATCINMGWPCLLVGPQSSGKTTVVTQLAALVGAELVSIPLIPETDVTELLGGFDKVNTGTETQAIFTEAINLAMEVCRMVWKKWSSSRILACRNSVASIWSSVRELCCVASAFLPPPVTSVERLLRNIFGLISEVESGYHSIGDEGYEASISLRLDTLKMQLKGLMMESVHKNDRDGTTSSIDLSSPPSLFKWVDGPLVTAMQRGAWVVFDKANMCSSSVLDRLNPLFEPDGTLLLPESGFVDREIVPHPRFRAFLTVDPTCGEISRSMRNRCVEIALIPPASAACCPCPGADEFIGAAPPAPSLALLDSVCAGSASGLPPEDALALVSTATGKTNISSCMAPQMDMRNLRHTAELQAELYRRGLKQRGHSSPSSYYSLSADATVCQCYEMWLVTPLPSPVPFSHIQRTVAGDSRLLQYLCGALHVATTTKQLGGFDNNPDVNHTHLPLLNMVVSVCGESAIPLFNSQLSLMKEMRSDERGEGLWDAKKIFNPMISPIPYCTAEVARRLCCSTDDMTLRSARPLGGGEIGDSIRSCMAYMISKVAKKINQALKGEGNGGSVDDVPMKRCDDKPGSDGCDNDKISCCLKEQQFDSFSNYCSYDCPMDPRVDSETELPMLHGSTIATTSGDEVLVPMRLVLADIVFLDRLPWLWWESEFVKKRLKNIKLQCFVLRSDHDTLALRQVVPLLIPWLSITQTLAKLACAKVGDRRMKEEINDGTSSSSSAQRNTATTIPDMPLSSSTGVVDEEETHRRPSSSSLPLFTLIELVLTERDNLCSVFAPWALQYDDQNSDEQSMQFPWEQFIVQWRRAEAAVMNITSHLSLLEDVTDGKLQDVCHQTLGICKKISSAVVRKAGGALPLLTISKEASYYSPHVGGLQLRQNEKPPLPSCAVDAEAIQNLRSISDAMKVDMTVWKIGEDGMDLRSSLTDSDIFLSLLLPLSSPIDLRTDVLNALATLACTVTTDYSIKSSRCASVSSSHNRGHHDMRTDQQQKLLHYKLPLALKKSQITNEKKFLAAWEFVKHGKWVINAGNDAGEEVGQVVAGNEWRMNGQKGRNSLVAEGKEYEIEENWVISKQIDLQLLVLAQHWAAVEELSLLVELENALGKEEKVYNETCSEYRWCPHTHKWSELMFWLRQLVYLLLEQGGCSPRDLVAHQTFLWSCDAAFESLDSLKSHFTCLHQSLLQMKEGCFRRFWTGAFNAYDQIVSMPVGCGKGKSVPIQVCPNFRGPSLALQYCLRSDILFRMCQGCADGGQDTSVDGSFDVTISNIAARSRQLRLAFDMMVTLPYNPPALGYSGHVLMEHARCTLLNVLSMIQVALPKFPVNPSLPDLSSGIDSVATCTTERFQVVAKLLLLPAAKLLSIPHEKDLTAAAAASSALMFDSHAGCALSLIGAFKLQLCIPADSVDPVRLSAVEESILRLCLSRFDLDIAVRLTSSVLFRGANKRPDTLHIKKRRTELEKECIALKQTSAERPPSAAPFAALFKEIHMFAKGLGSPEHIARLVQSLVSVFGMNRDQEALHQQRCNYLQEEKVWQSAAGAFAERLRQNFTYYDDVTVPILESLGLIRAGLRIIAGSVETYSHGDRHTTRSSVGLDINQSVPSSPIMFLLGNFPWACRNVENKESQHLSYQLSSSSNIRERDEFSSVVLATCSPNTSGEGRTEFICAILKRIQLLLLCGAISSSEGVSESSRVIETYAQAWKYASNMEEDRKMEDVSTFGYRSRDLGKEQLVEEDDNFNNDDEIEKAAIHRLFPDFSSLFDVDGSEEYELLNSGGIAAANDKNHHTIQQQNSCQTITVKNKDLALIGKLHASIFIAQVGHMATTALEETICYNSNITKRMPWWHYCISALSDVHRTSAFETSYRAACLLQDERTGKVVSLHSSTLELATIEERLAASHLFALSTAMEYYLPAEQRLTESDSNAETLRCRLQNTEFYRTPSPAEAVRMSIPLTVLLQSVAGLLRDYFPGNAVLLAIARCTERVRGLSVQTSVAQLLAGAQAVLTKAQAWEDVASQAVSLRECLKPISQLVVRWRKFELEGWRNLMKAREDRMNEKAMEWWPWIHSLVLSSDDSGCNVKKPPQCDVIESGGVNLPMEVVDEPQNVPLKQQSTAEGGDHKKKKHSDDDVFCSRQPSMHYSVDWITSFCHDTTTANDGCVMTQKTSWLWRGFPDATPAPTEVVEEETILHSNVFDALDTFLRTSTVGEFEGRLYLIRALSGQLACSSRLLNGEVGNDNNAIDGSSARESGLGRCNAQELSIYQHRLSLLLLRLWRHYHQFYASVKAFRDNSKAPIEKSILDEVKLGKWDDQTYYSLAEASQRTHRKLTRLLKAYDELLESSVAPILHNELVKGIGENRMGLATSMDEVPSPSSVFYVVADVDGEEDLKVYSDADTDRKVIEKDTNKPPNGLEDVSHSFTWLKENIRATSSLSPLLFFATLRSSAVLSSSSNNEILSRHGDVSQTEEWLKNLPALCIRMHYLLSSRLFNDGGEGLKGIMCAEVAEDICAAIFSRMDVLRQYDIEKRVNKQIEIGGEQQGSGVSSGSTKAVKKRAVLDLLQELKGQGLDARPRIPWEVKHVDISMSLPSPFSLTLLTDSDSSSHHDELWHRADRYFSRSVAELVRLRLEANTTSSRDVTQREVQAMLGFCEDLNLILLQQRAVIDAATTTLGKFEGIVHAHSSLVRTYSSSSSSPCNVNDPVKEERGPMLPPQTWNAMFHVDKQCRSLLCVLEGLREASLLVRSVRKSRTADLSSESTEEIAFNDLMKQLDAAVDVVLGCLNNLSDWSWNEYTPVEVLVTSELTQILDGNVQTMANLADSLENMCTTTSSSGTTTTLIPRCVLLRVTSELRRTTILGTAMVDDGNGGCNSNASEEFDNEESNNSVMMLLQAACESTIKELLLLAQRMLCHSTRKMNEKTRNHGNKLLLERQADAYDQLKGICVGLNRSFITLGTVHALLKKETNNSGISVDRLLHTATCIMELAVQVCDGARAVMRGAVAMHKSCAKLQYVLLRVFRSIVVNGLCENAEVEEDETGSDNGETEMQMGSEGAGVGSGKGAKDISSEIDDEEQLLGMKDEKEEDGGDATQQPRELTKEEAREGVEMSHDFDGELYDVPQENESEEGDEEKEGEEQQDQMEREMGDVGDMGDIVDQGLWEDDEEDNVDDSNMNNQKEEYNSSGKMEGGTNMSDEIRTKEGEEDDSESCGERKNDEQQNQDKNKPLDSDTVTQEDNENNNQDDDVEEEGIDGPVNEDKSMDGDQDGKSRKVDNLFEEDDKGGEQEGNQNGTQNDLPDNMQLDRSSSGNDNNSEADDDQTADDDTSMMDVDNPMDVDLGSDSGETVEEEDDNSNPTANSRTENDVDKVEEAMGNAERGASGGVASSHEQVDDQNERGGGVAGVGQTDNDDALCGSKDEHDDLQYDRIESTEQQGFDESQDSGMRRGETEGGMSYREGTAPNNEEANSEFKKNKLQGPEAPNPMKIPGDVLKHWERRLNVLQMSESMNEEESTAEESQCQEGGEKHEEESKSQAYQYANTVNETTAQVLGAANEDTLESQQPQMEPDRKLEEKKMNEDDFVKREEEEEDLRIMEENSGKSRLNAKTINKKQMDGGGGRAKTTAVKTEDVKGEEDLSDNKNEEEDNDKVNVSFQGTGYSHSEPRDNLKAMVVDDDHDSDGVSEGMHVNDEKSIPLTSGHVNEWRKLRAITQPLAGRLCERLRLVLMAQVASRLQGDYRSGKRINMKRVIGYVASHFRKDKIWLRRTKPAKRDYQVMLVIDDTQSMKDGREPLLQAAATAVQALAQLEVGQVGVAAFRSHLNILHAIGDPWTDEAGANVVKGLSFVDRGGEDANVKRILREASTELSKGGMTGTMNRLSSLMSSNRPPRQLVVLFSDGLFDEAQRNGLRLQIRGMEEKGQLVVLVIIAHDLEEGILTITNWDPEKAISRPYLDDYPFPYYLVLKDVRSLPELLSDALRQWFELASEAL